MATTLLNTHRTLTDFDEARRKAIWREWLSLLTRRKNKLLSFDQFRHKLPLRGYHYLGYQLLPIDKIVGSEGRSHEFDRAFYPRAVRSRNRWLKIDQAHYDGIVLPPVELIKVGQVYFVRDGNHRVSVARARGQKMVDAYVTELELASQ